MGFKLGPITIGNVGPQAQLVAASASATGTVATLPRLLGSTSTFSIVSGNSNLSVSGSTIQAAAALGYGASQQVVVREYDSGSLRAVENPVTITTPAGVPAAPTLGAPTAGNGQVSIPFTDGATNGAAITSHKVYRGSAAGGETLLGTLTGSSPFIDTGLTNGAAYYYKLSAVNSAGEGPLSAEVSATPTARTGIAHWDAAVAKVKAGSGSAVLAFVGDSTTNGYGGTAYTTSYAYQMVAYLQNKGIPAVYTGCWSQYGTDSRVVLTSGASAGGQAQITPGYQFTASGGSLTYTPPHNVDTFDIYLIQGGSNGVANVTVDGGSSVVATLSTNGASATKKVTVSVPKGQHSITVTWVSGSVWINGIDAYDSTASYVRVIGLGKPGSSSTNYTGAKTGNFAPANMLNTLLPDLAVIGLGINDWNNSVTTSTYQTNMQTFIGNVKGAATDVLLFFENSTGTSVTEATQLTFGDVLTSLASSNGLMFPPSIRATLGTYATANANGDMSDTLHPKPSGYAKYPAAIGPSIAP